jgi:hypothetical protein
MRNEMINYTHGVRWKSGWQLVALASLGCYANQSFANQSFAVGNNIEVILDGFAYAIFSDISIDLEQKTIMIIDSEIENCLRSTGSLPLNTANLTLMTNNQDIGIEQFRYLVDSRLLYLSSETSDIVCDNGVFVDHIFYQGFE